MPTSKLTIIVPILLIVVGSGWLLSSMNIMPDIVWVWTLGLLATGVLTFAVAGINKFTIVVGSLFVVAGGLSVLRQTGHLKLNVEVPILVIAIGILMLIARHPAIPAPKWYHGSEDG